MIGYALAMRWMIALSALAVACSSRGGGRSAGSASDVLAAKFPLARLGDRELCDKLLARREAEHRVHVDHEPKVRRKVVVSDLHLGPGTRDTRFAGIEDFYAEAEWLAFLDRHAAAGPTDLIVAGDFVEFWQIATVLGALPKRTDKLQHETGPVLAADQDAGVKAIELVIAAHPEVFRALGKFIARGDNRVIIIPGNHDADLLWPKVQLAVARAIAPSDPSRLLILESAAYQHAGVHVEHGHAYEPANRFTTGHAPFGRDREGKCRLQSNWGEIFVDQFYTDIEKKLPFIDNLYPQSAAMLWAVRDNPDPERDVGAALRFLELIRVAESRAFNKDAAKTIVTNILGTSGKRGGGPESVSDVIEHLSDRLVNGDPNAITITDAAMRFLYDPDLDVLWKAIVRAARALPDFPAALGELRAIDPNALSNLRDKVFGEPLQNSAKKLMVENPALSVVVFGHTHDVGGMFAKLDVRGRTGYYLNTGSWLSVASVAELRKRGITWDKLSLVDRTQFPSKTTSVVIEYDGATPRTPRLENAN
jgi:UDP-2,3-diacylglucosamine pyrophosphatase LpxH